MAKAYSMDLRERVLKDCDAGMRSEDVAAKYTVSASWVYDLRKKRRETGHIAPKEYKRGAKLKLASYLGEKGQNLRTIPKYDPILMDSKVESSRCRALD